MMDWFPTFSTLAGARLPDDRAIDGEDISAVLTTAGDRQGQQFFYLSSFATQPVAYRDGDWKLKLPRSGYPQFLDGIIRLNFYAHDLLLFNLADDPSETQNLAGRYPEKVTEMSEAIQKFDESIKASGVRWLDMREVPADLGDYMPVMISWIIYAVLALLLSLLLVYLFYRLVRSLW